jgi:bifunctional non-homologous end joining protein LigD
MSLRPLSSAFIAPCLPSSSKTPPSGIEWLHEIKHDGFFSIVRKEGKRVKLYTAPATT